MTNSTTRSLLLGLTLLFAGLIASSGSTAPQTAARQIIPQGTVLPVKIDTTLSSATNHVGDRFTATVHDSPDFPTGTQVGGIVREVQSASKNQPGMIDVDFTTVRLLDGQSHTIQGSLTSIDERSVTHASSGRLISKGKRNNRDKFIAYGAGAGLVIGAVTKSNIVKGTLLGAAAGWIYSELTKNKARPSDVTVKQGTEFGVRLDRQLALAPNRNTAIRVTMDGQPVGLGASNPVVDRGHVLVPLFPVLEEANISHRFDANRKIVRVEKDDADIYLKIGQSYALVDGERQPLQAPAQVRNGEVYVPLSFLKLATGMRVVYQPAVRTVALSTASVASR